MERKFKKGDRVRFIGESHYIDDGIEKGDIVAVIGEGFDDDCSKVKVNTYTYIANEDLELVERHDPVTEFITQLQALMRMYDVTISDYEQYKVCMQIGTESVCWKTMDLDEITYENIFDYEK